MKYILFILIALFSLSATASTVGAKAEKLQAIMGNVAHNDSYKVKTSKSVLKMVKEYIAAKYAEIGDSDTPKEYKFVTNAPGLDTDTEDAGTIVAKVAEKEVQSDWMTEKQSAFAKKLIHEIDEAGGSFGFDGFEENGCAAPTAFMLIIDPDGGKVYGVDLTPCLE